MTGRVSNSWPERSATLGRLKAFGERYGADALYTDAAEMLRSEALDIVAVATNVKGRADLTCLAVECGAKAIAVEKPIAHTLEEVDRMVITSAVAGVPLVAGATPANHPSYARAKELVRGGAIGDVVSIEADAPAAQKQHWMYFVDEMPLWVVGVGERERRESGSDEFLGQGLAQTRGRNPSVHFRKGAGLVRVSGTSGEILLDSRPGSQWRLWQDVDTGSGTRRVENTMARASVRGRLQRGMWTVRPDRLYGGEAGRAKEFRATGSDRAGSRNRLEDIRG